MYLFSAGGAAMVFRGPFQLKWSCDSMILQITAEPEFNKSQDLHQVICP